ncbi:MAG: tRNA (guanosine(37)-N1)-methyltransferase TrmD [Bordetella sp.]|nr:MAG: tRNA (guanosine(37)-N1)-methyltransferase TrmD [Bordetella sp.]
MRIDVISLFPEIFISSCKYGVIGRAYLKSLWKLHVWNPKDFTENGNSSVDDRPYGGGPGMVMKADSLERTTNSVLKARAQEGLDKNIPPIILLTPTGIPFNQKQAKCLSNGSGGILICGRYKGVDQRFIDRCVTQELSLGDFVISGGEIAALAIIDAVVRLLPGVLNNNQSSQQDSFHPNLKGLLDNPHYTRPRIYKNSCVPECLLSGNHEKISEWKRRESLILTAKKRPDLIVNAKNEGLISESDEQIIQDYIS